MREILFKAKRKDNDEWVEGCIWTMLDNSNGSITKKYFIRDKNYSVYGSYSWKDYEVIPETVSQYTGLTDKNGVKIFENDVVEVISDNWDIIEPKERKFVVEYRQDSFGIGYELADLFDFEVIGNIFDKEVK